MIFRKKELHNLDEAAAEQTLKDEAELAFEAAAEENKKKTFAQARQELQQQDAQLLAERDAGGQSEEATEPADFYQKSKTRRRSLAVAAFVLLLGIGIMGNWYFENAEFTGSVKPLITGSDTKTLGEAEYVDATTAQPITEENAYFSEARLSRETARDEALEKLQAVVDSPEESAEAKQTAAEAITQMSNYIAVENKIETLVAAKGVSHCLAVVSSDGAKVDVIVDVDELTDALSVAIKEIAMQQLGCAFDAVTIIQSN